MQQFWIADCEYALISTTGHPNRWIIVGFAICIQVSMRSSDDGGTVASETVLVSNCVQLWAVGLEFDGCKFSAQFFKAKVVTA